MTPRQDALSGVIICPAHWEGQRLKVNSFTIDLESMVAPSESQAAAMPNAVTKGAGTVGNREVVARDGISAFSLAVRVRRVSLKLTLTAGRANAIVGHCRQARGKMLLNRRRRPSKGRGRYH